MGRKLKQHARLLERIFSRQEWEYLKRNKEFSEQLAGATDTLDDFEALAIAGDMLLKKSEDANPGRAKFKRTSTRFENP
jgi:hypothetical protein